MRLKWALMIAALVAGTLWADSDTTLTRGWRFSRVEAPDGEFLKGGFDALVDLSKLKKATYRWEGGVLKVTSAKGMIIMFLQ